MSRIQRLRSVTAGLSVGLYLVGIVAFVFGITTASFDGWSPLTRSLTTLGGTAAILGALTWLITRRRQRYYSASGSVLIARSAETVFDFISNPHRTSAVNPRLRLQRTEPQSDHRHRSYYAGRTAGGLLPVSLAIEVDTSQRPWRLTATGRRNRTSVRYTYSLEPVAEGTRLHLLVEVWQRLWFRTSAWISARMLNVSIDRMLQRFRLHIEVA